ncbi:FimD/PapC N-terminal domain-containing protein [Cronobacter turicensis]
MAADDIQFNTDVLDVKDKKNIDLSQFSKRGYIMPGNYDFKIKVNQNELEEQPVSVFAAENDKTQSIVCFTQEQIQKFGFKEKYLPQFKSWHNGQCVDITALQGVEVTPDLGNSTLMISVPQAYLEYTSDDWVPPSMWDDGIAGLLADYNVNAQTRHNEGG